MKTTPMPHQAAELTEHGLDQIRAVFWEQGLGKTWLALAEAETLYRAGSIDAMLVLAPNGIHKNWETYELPPHLGVPWKCFAFDSSKAASKKAQAGAGAVLEYREGLAVLVMSYDGIKTAAGKALAKKFLTKRGVFYVLDESNRIKTPSAVVTRTVLASGKYATFKRLLCGTPITNTPFDAYTQVKFLNPAFWDNTPYGLSSFGAFKAFFGVWEDGYNGRTDQSYKVLKAYKNLEILKKLLESVASRLLKEDVLTLPPKVYSYRGFDMTAKQRRLYDELESEFMTMLGDEIVMAPLAITRMLRLQQITCGYLPTTATAGPAPADDYSLFTGLEAQVPMPVGQKFMPIDERNPRLDLLRELCEDLPHKAIIWARFRADIDQIVALLGNCCTRWDGSVPIDIREQHKRRFLEDPSCQFMAATPESMGEGHTLTVAKTEIYYSNSFKLKERLQSEDRAHRIGTDTPVHIIDIVANNSLDLKIVAALRNKFDVATSLIDSKFRTWLTSPDGSLADQGENNLQKGLTQP